MYRIRFFICLYLVKSCNSQDELFEGSACLLNGSTGVCTNIKSCRSAIAGLRQDKHPQICSFAGMDPIVCCIDKQPTAEAETTTKLQWTTTPEPTTSTPATPMLPAKSLFEKEPAVHVEEKSIFSESTGCPPISPKDTAPKTGQKAWDKCIEYQEQLVLPCDASQGKRVNYCRSDLNIWILDGEDAYEGEFPHMALLGYGSDPKALEFLCGGTLISDKFVLTAGHCMASKELGAISYVLLGILSRSSYNESNLHKVRTVHKHPQYTPPKKYNDIALVELESAITLTDLAIPACLDVGGMSQEEVAIATGWGATAFRGNSSDILQKVDLTRFSDVECSQNFPTSRHLQKGFDKMSQVCFGDRTMSKDTCQGDSGGPLQVRHKQIYCMYAVIGVTSFGRACGMPGQPAIYTRVAHYVPWLEALVWPDN